MSVEEGFLLAAIGATAGVYGTIIGAGGGFLLAPLLVLLFDIEPAEVVGTSLGVVLVNGFSGTIIHARQRRIEWAVGLWIAILAIPASLAAAYLIAEHVSGAVFSILLGLLLLGLALFIAQRLVRQRSWSKASEMSPPPAEGGSQVAVDHVLGRSEVPLPIHSLSHRRTTELVTAGGGLGFISGMFGIGAGFLVVPLLVTWLRMAPRHATATAIFTLIPYSAAAFLLQVALGNVVWGFIAAAGPPAVIGAQAGGYVSARIHPSSVMAMLAAATMMLGIFLLVDGSL